MSRSETFRPLYKTLVDKIELDIIRRNLKTGDFFCVLKDLCDQYQVSIITVRKAVSIRHLYCQPGTSEYLEYVRTYHSDSTSSLHRTPESVF